MKYFLEDFCTNSTHMANMIETETNRIGFIAVHVGMLINREKFS